ncbi:hypothetical protein CWI36_1906p0010, partial [Hamiltosporidium magnivora]
CGKLYLDKHITDLHDDLFAISCYHITYLLDSIRFYKTYEIHPDYDLSNHIEALSLCFNIFTINNIHLSNFTEVSRLNNKFIDIISDKALIEKWEDNICTILFEFQEKIYPEIANEIIFQKYFDIYNYFINRKYFDSSLISTIFLIISNIIHHKKKEKYRADIYNFTIRCYKDKYHGMLILYLKSVFLLLKNYNHSFRFKAINRFLEIINTTAFENEIQKECILCEINLQMGVLNTFIINDEMNLNEKIIFRYSDGFLSTNIIKASNSDDNSFLYDLYENIEKKSVFIEVSIDIFICCLNNLNCDTRNIEIHKIFDFILKNIFCYSMVVFKLPSCLDSDYMKKFFDKLFSDDILVNIFIKTVSNEFDKIYVALGEIQRLVSIKAKENKPMDHPINIIVYNLLFSEKMINLISSLKNTSRIQIFTKIRANFKFNIFANIYSFFDKYIESIPPSLRKNFTNLRYLAANEEVGLGRN